MISAQFCLPVCRGLCHRKLFTCCCLPVLVGGFPKLLLLPPFASATSGERNQKVYESTSHHSTRYVEFTFTSTDTYTLFGFCGFFLLSFFCYLCLNRFSLNFLWELEVRVQRVLSSRRSMGDNDIPVRELEKELFNLKCYQFLVVLKSRNSIHEPFRNTLCCFRASSSRNINVIFNHAFVVLIIMLTTFFY